MIIDEQLQRRSGVQFRAGLHPVSPFDLLWSIDALRCRVDVLGGLRSRKQAHIPC